MSLFVDGGVVMFPVLALGGVATALAARHLVAPSGAAAAAAATARSALGLAALGGSALDLWAVAKALGSEAFAEADLLRVALVGGGEAMAPAVLGLGLAALAAAIATLGDTRRASPA